MHRIKSYIITTSRYVCVFSFMRFGSLARNLYRGHTRVLTRLYMYGDTERLLVTSRAERMCQHV